MTRVPNSTLTSYGVSRELSDQIAIKAYSEQATYLESTLASEFSNFANDKHGRSEFFPTLGVCTLLYTLHCLGSIGSGFDYELIRQSLRLMQTIVPNLFEEDLCSACH